MSLPNAESYAGVVKAAVSGGIKSPSAMYVSPVSPYTGAIQGQCRRIWAITQCQLSSHLLCGPQLLLLLLLLLLQPFNCLFSRTTWVSQYQKGKNQSWFKRGKRWWGLGMHWHQPDHMQAICTSLQTGSHTNTSSLNFFCRPDAP